MGIANQNRNMREGHAWFEAASFLTPDESIRTEDKAFRMELETQGRRHCEIKTKYILNSERLNKAGYVRIK